MSQYYLVFSFVKNCLADSGLVHGILALLLSQHLVMQMKGNNDDIWRSDRAKGRWYELFLFSVFVNMFTQLSLDSEYHE